MNVAIPKIYGVISGVNLESIDKIKYWNVWIWEWYFSFLFEFRKDNDVIFRDGPYFLGL